MVSDNQIFLQRDGRVCKRTVFLLLMLLTVPACLQGVHASVLGFVEFEGQEDNKSSPGYFTRAVVESPDGRFVYSVSSVNTNLNAFMRDAGTGMITLIQSLDDTGDYGLRSAGGMVISPDGKYIYVSGFTNRPFDQSISWFVRDAASGRLTYRGKILQADDIPDGYANPNGELRISPDGFFLYAGDKGGQLIVFRRASNGLLRHVQTYSATDELRGLKGFVVSPDGRNLYALSNSSQSLNVFERNLFTGKLTAIQRIMDIHKDGSAGVAGLQTVEDIIVSADGQFVYSTGKRGNDPSTADDDQYTVLMFARNTTDGTLVYRDSSVNAVPFRDRPARDTLAWPTSLAFSADSEQTFLYVATQNSNAINVFRRNPVDGSLAWLGWVTDGEDGVSNLRSVQDLIVSHDGRHIYAALEQGDGIGVFDTRADLSVTTTDSTDPVEPNGNFSYTLAVTNNGPADAYNVMLTNTAPVGMKVTRATANVPGASCEGTGVTVTCELGMIAATGAVNTVIEVVAPVMMGAVRTSSAVVADQLDTETANSIDTEETCIEESGSDACSGSAGTGTAPPLTGVPQAATGGGGGSVGVFWLLMLTVFFFTGYRMYPCTGVVHRQKRQMRIFNSPEHTTYRADR